jgi:hypothetical protein
MPFTPYHFGPGAAVKAVIPRYFSFTVFCFAQVVIDCETAYHMLRHEYPIHRWMHTYVGATAIAVFCIVVGRPICQGLLRFWHASSAMPFKSWFPGSDRISLLAATIGASVGTYSHVFLDSIMHADVQPLQPWTNANACYGIIGWVALHALCILLGIAGAFFVARQSTK